jgi:hypothetical protein
VESKLISTSISLNPFARHLCSDALASLIRRRLPYACLVLPSINWASSEPNKQRCRAIVAGPSEPARVQPCKSLNGLHRTVLDYSGFELWNCGAPYDHAVGSKSTEDVLSCGEEYFIGPEKPFGESLFLARASFKLLLMSSCNVSPTPASNDTGTRRVRNAFGCDNSHQHTAPTYCLDYI